ncbi:hypothetical protein G6K93_30790 [Agrobacterium rhizogenes]|uniref:HNH endonuclease n=1 Tax=Rhizobium rhizogenes TaxID=359 RepID=A0A7S5DRL2_RHIRH|nr:hypothetical protein [Rhizobium rhizogenes]NTF52701.1 hypothetical protein [Rhizobium rhizogenes]NTH09962.1 hypothetical protein [Rhizobium rhizogenes]NTI06752.1 hypothetical protein [Rhizobium rhizogenes]NTI13557.1 hypothetical protein [Rhizobium rhizogenes]NTI91362.1 hypothetical protein [Rhizobium rhizogenes]
MSKRQNVKKRQCVFCGQPPTNKNREHILPRWLLELTGDPSRVVTMAIDPQTGDPIKFSWSALVMPACEACNLEYSKLEEAVKPIVLALLDRKPMTSRQAFVLLDWLDKVRICLWLNQIIMQGTTGTIDPHLYVGNRIGTKDRLLYLYTLDKKIKGLNGFGIESLIFQHQPSCFALRVNDIILFNASSDHAFSRNCGFWHPERLERHIDGEFAGHVALIGSSITRKISHPLVDYPLLKAALCIVQPIAQRNMEGEFFGPLGQNESYHLSHMSDSSRGAGIIFRQLDDKVLPIYDLDAPMVLGTVDSVNNGNAGDIVAQVYRFQTYLFQSGGIPVGSEAAIAHAKSMLNILAMSNEMRAVLVERGQTSASGQDFATQAFRDAMAAAKRPAKSRGE